MDSPQTSNKHRVLVFVPEFPVISETFIEREISALTNLKSLELGVYSIQRGYGELSPNLVNKVTYVKISLKEIVLGLLTFLFNKPLLFIKGFQLVGLKDPYIFFKSLGYAKVFSRFNPDVIYSHFMSFPSTIGLVASILLECDFAISAHARDILDYPEFPKEKLKYSKFIAICNKNALEKYKDLCGDSLLVDFAKKVHLIYHGVTLVNEESVSNPSEKYILSVGRLVPKKGFEYLLEAFSTVSKYDQNLRLVLIGKGSLFRKLKERVTDFNLDSRVDFLGEKKFSEVRNLMANSLIYVQPSINTPDDEDGIPNTLIEAALFKLPIITTDAGSIGEFLTSKEALIVPQKDSSSLAIAIKKYLEDDKLKLEMGLSAYNKAKKMFDIDRNISKIEELLIK